MTAWLLLLLGVVLTVGTALFVAAEFSLVALDRPTVQKAVDAGEPGARSVLTSHRRLSTQLSACQLGITLTTLVLGFIASPSIGALLMGIPSDDVLVFAGRVGTGFTDRDLANLKKTLAPLEAEESPFTKRLTGPDAKGVTFVRPELVGEVRFSERTSDGRLRQPSWRGLRPDKSPGEVVWE